jgi:hypothetical protein
MRFQEEPRMARNEKPAAKAAKRVKSKAAKRVRKTAELVRARGKVLAKRVSKKLTGKAKKRTRAKVAAAAGAAAVAAVAGVAVARKRKRKKGGWLRKLGKQRQGEAGWGRVRQGHPAPPCLTLPHLATFT